MLLVALVLASGCGQASSPPPERPAAPPAPGAIVYSVDVDAILLAYEQGMLVDGSGTTNLTETDHRVVRAVADDGRVMVLDDDHDQGGGLYLRWQPRSGRVHQPTHRRAQRAGGALRAPTPPSTSTEPI